MDPLRWTDGEKNLRCAYRKLSNFTSEGDWFGISVFVNRHIAPDRPIAVTVLRSHNQQEVGRQQVALSDPRDEVAAIMTVATALERLGYDAELSAYRADEVAALITRDADAIQAALEQSVV